MALLAIAYGMRRENESSSIQKNIHDNMPPESILLQQQQEDFTEPSEHLMFSGNQEKDVGNFDSQEMREFHETLQLDEKEKVPPQNLMGMISEDGSERIEWPSGSGNIWGRENSDYSWERVD